MIRRPSIAIALLLVLAGCGGLAGPADEQRTVNPNLAGAPSATATPDPTEDYPPGVSADGVDARELANAHVAALEDRPNAVRVHTTVVAANGTTLVSRTATTRENGSRSSVSLVTDGAAPAFLGDVGDYAYWSDGNETLVRQEQWNGSVEHGTLPGDSEPAIGFTDTGRSVVEPALLAREFRYVGTERRGNATYHVLTADAGTVERDERADARNYRLTVAVTPEGVVESMTTRYDTARDGVEFTYVQRFRVSDVDGTTVDRPAWADEVMGNVTATTTP
ncbi:hypothetical protein [Halorarum salinum]|uniref:Uncharacterized protein n=1 Tax=Halorarum salinum TaxID=2743089 RepID=A0A7D5L9G5_9EURY|nr:hypothetical protein [Halobaculum salinum]QLG61466.1 hypothetical protein HUG12_06845 [Halobaculum salinum]